MILVEIRDERTRYILTAELQNGDLVVSASDFSPSVKQAFETDEYEYIYVVKAAHVERIWKALDASEATMLDRLHELLTPHGYTASTHFEAWLTERRISYDFSVWR